jgi:hypothetical protein
VTQTSRSREEKFRSAQHRAFEQVARASNSKDRREKMGRAVEEIVEACESYLDFSLLDQTA